MGSDMGAPAALVPAWNGVGYVPMNLSDANMGGVANASKVWIVGESLMSSAPVWAWVFNLRLDAYINRPWWGSPPMNVSWHDQKRPMINIGFLDGHVEYLEMEYMEPVHSDMWAGAAQEFLNPYADAPWLIDTIKGAAYWGDPARER
jgi:prepilin-type processing-associated H-X9-DG protein